MTPFQQKLHQERQARLARFAQAAARHNSSQEAPPEVQIEDPIPVVLQRAEPETIEQWVERQCKRYQPWFSITEEIDSVLPSVPSVEHIQRLVARRYRMSRKELLSDRRVQAVARPRQIAIYLARHMTIRSLNDIGRRFGGKDHSTVVHAMRTIQKLIDRDEAFACEIENLKLAILKAAE